MATQRDLSLAYSPGVAVPVRAIAEDPAKAYDYTAKGNLVAVISNGTAILGLGNLGALASKPVMEGKAVLFKRFADVDSIDIEITSRDPDEIITVIKNIGPTFGGINLEDIKAPECFEIEHVDPGEFLEQHRLAFHHRLGGKGTDVAQAQHGGTVGDHRHQVAACGVAEGIRRVGDDLLAGRGHAR